MSHYQAVKGTRDIFPEEAAQWKYVEGIVHSLASLYGFSEIRTPVFEYTELFQRGIGATTDIVGKEMFSLSARSKRAFSNVTSGNDRGCDESGTSEKSAFDGSSA